MYIVVVMNGETHLIARYWQVSDLKDNIITVGSQELTNWCEGQLFKSLGSPFFPAIPASEFCLYGQIFCSTASLTSVITLVCITVRICPLTDNFPMLCEMISLSEKNQQTSIVSICHTGTVSWFDASAFFHQFWD